MMHDGDVCDAKPDCSMDELDNDGNDDDSHDNDPNDNPRSVADEGFSESFLEGSDSPTILGDGRDVCESIVGSRQARGVEGVARFDAESSDHESDPIDATAVLGDVDPCNHESDQAGRSGTIELGGDSPRARVSGVPIDPKIPCPDKAIIRSDADLTDQGSREGGFEGLDRSGVVEIGQNDSYLEKFSFKNLGGSHKVLRGSGQSESILVDQECSDGSPDLTGRSGMSKLTLDDPNPKNFGFENLGASHKGLRGSEQSKPILGDQECSDGSPDLTGRSGMSKLTLDDPNPKFLAMDDPNPSEKGGIGSRRGFEGVRCP